MSLTIGSLQAQIDALRETQCKLHDAAITAAANELADNYAIPFAIDALINVCESAQPENGGEIWLGADLECHSSWLIESGLLVKQMYWIGLDGDLQAMSDDEYEDFSAPVDGQYTDYDYGYAISKDKFFASITFSYLPTPLLNEVLNRYLKSVA